MIYVLLSNITRDERMRSIREAVRRHENTPGSLQTELLIILATLVVIALGLMILAGLQRTKRQRSPRNPGRLFREVLRPLELSFSERLLLRRVARNLKLNQPTMLLLSPQYFSQSADNLLKHSPWASARTSLRARLEAISRKLFGQPLLKQDAPPAEEPEPEPTVDEPSS